MQVEAGWKSHIMTKKLWPSTRNPHEANLSFFLLWPIKTLLCSCPHALNPSPHMHEESFWPESFTAHESFDLNPSPYMSPLTWILYRTRVLWPESFTAHESVDLKPLPHMSPLTWILYRTLTWILYHTWVLWPETFGTWVLWPESFTAHESFDLNPLPHTSPLPWILYLTWVRWP